MAQQQQHHPFIQALQPDGPTTTPKARPEGIEVFTCNIRDGRGGPDSEAGLIGAISMVSKVGHDLGIITETKIGDDIHTKSRLGYSLSCSKAELGPNGGPQGGIGLLEKENQDGWHTESLLFHGPNVLSCVLASGTKRVPLIGGYLPPSTLMHLPHLEEALDRFAGGDPICLGDLNVDLHDLTKERNQLVADCVASCGLFDLLPHFRQRARFRHKTTWWQVRGGAVHRSRCDYVIGTDRRLFESVSTRDPRSHSSDNFLLRGRLLRQPTKSHKKYLRRKRFPLSLPKMGPLSKSDLMFQEIKGMANPPLPNAPRPRPQWLSAETLRLIDTRASLRWNPWHSRQQARVLSRQINQSLKADRRRRAEEAATQIGECLNGDNSDLQGAFDILKRWHRHASARPPKPSRQDLTKLSTEYRALHSRQNPPGLPVPPNVAPFPINDAVPSEAEICAAASKMKLNKAPGHTRVRAEDFKAWLKAAYPPTDVEGAPAPDPVRWNKLVGLSTTHLVNR